MAALLLLIALALQDAPDALRADSQHLTIDVLDRGADDTGARLMIARKDTTRYHIVTLNRALGRLRSVRIRSDEGRVIVVTDRGFAVVEPLGRVPQEEVYGYGATASHDAHWIAYMRALRDEANEDTGDGIVIYDTMRTPDQNRAEFPIAAERSSAAGSPVYPPAHEWKKSSGMEPTTRPHAGAYQWWDRHMYVGALRTPSGDRLVLADVSQPAIRVCTKVLPQDPERWVEGSVTVGQRDGNYIVEIRSRARGNQPDTILSPADCSE